MKLLVTGGNKMGKTAYALRRVEELAPACERVYLATMIPADKEDEERIRRHREEREGRGFVTVEYAAGPSTGSGTAKDVVSAGPSTGSGTASATSVRCVRAVAEPVEVSAHGTAILIDSLTSMLQNAMFTKNTAEDGHATYSFHPDAAEQVYHGLQAISAKTVHTVFVSDYIYSDVIHFGSETEAFRKGLAWLNRKLALDCDEVIEVTLGIPQDIRRSA